MLTVPSCRAKNKNCVLLGVKFSKPGSERLFLCPGTTFNVLFGVLVSKWKIFTLKI